MSKTSQPLPLPLRPRPAPARTRASQRGQVLVWFLAFATTIAIIFAGVYSVGQVTSEKQKVVNATDAAAYSGALVEARALNLVAYTNRSVIANEVLIGQMISLQSWTQYFERATSNYERVLSLLGNVPYVGVVFKAMATMMKALNKVASVQQKALKSIVPTAINGWELLFRTWYMTAIKPAFTPPVMALAAKSAANAVLQQNVATQGGRRDEAPRLIETTALMARNEVEWQRATKEFSGNDRKYAKELLLASRDAFSTDRPGSSIPIFNFLFGNSSVCFPFVFKFGSEKRGPTRIQNFDRWEAQDTVEFKQKLGPGGFDGCSWGKGTVAEPVGWGRSVADRQGRTNGTSIRTDGGAGNLAYSATTRNGGWSGVKSLYDIDRGADGKPRQEELTYAIAAAKGKSAIRTNDTMNVLATPSTRATGSAELKTGFAKDQLMAISEARIFFSRPVRNSRDITAGGLFRADSHQEYASLYNPYWQVRLSSPSEATRLIVYGAAGLNPALSAFAQ